MQQNDSTPSSKIRLKTMTRQEKSWILYDWANSVYATVMLAAVFPIYFTGMANEQLGNNSGDYWWSIGSTVAMATIAVLAPIVGAFADYKGYKKKIFIFFLFLGLAFTLYCGFTNNWVGMLIGHILSHIGFSGSCLVYDTFLTDVTSEDRVDTISSYGYAFGYIGGSTIPFIISILLIQFLDITLAIRISLVISVVWWGIFAIPMLKNVHQKHYMEKPEKGILKQTFINVGHTAKRIFQNKKIFWFVLAYFFYIDGVGTVINMSTSYGTTLGLDSVSMILALLVTQLVAFPCAILFSRFSQKYGSLRMLTFAVIMYFFICITGFIMGFGLEEGMFGIPVGQVLFWILAFMVGTVQGGIQAISRSHFSKMVPPENSGEFFGFFDIFGRFAAVIGPALYAFTRSTTGRSSFAILSIILLFLIALLILHTKRDILTQKD